MEKNKVKYGLSNVHYAKITAWSEDGTTPTYDTPVRLPGAVKLSIDPNGENENFYADNIVYYVLNNNAGYTGELEIALVTTHFATEILGETVDSNGVLVENCNAEFAQFALFFEFEGDKNKIRHVIYCCSASRTKSEGDTTEESKSVKTETVSLKASPLPNGLVKCKTCEKTDEETYTNWYKSVYIPSNEPAYDSTRIALIQLNSSFKDTKNVQYFDTLAEVKTALDAGTENMYKVVIGNDTEIVTVGISAFINCSNLVYMVFNDSLKSIGNSAFNGCTALKAVSLPLSVVSLGDGVFFRCTSLVSAEIAGAPTMGDGVFQNCTALSSVTLSSDLQSISSSTFNGCTSLTSINLPSELKNIGSSAFKDCHLTEIEIPSGVLSISTYSFDGCTQLASVVLNSGLLNISEGAFRNCTALESIEIPASVTSIHGHTFDDCTNLTSITVDKAEDSVTGSPWGATNATVTWTG